jgi:DNA-binding response OmpR family regulator
MTGGSTRSYDILIVDDEPNVRFIMERTLNQANYTITYADNGAEALSLLAEKSYQVLLLDLHMQPISGIQVLADLRKNNHETEVIILTGYSDLESAIDALRLGAFDYLIKPVQPDILRQRVATALKRYDQNLYKSRLREQIASLQSTLLAIEPDSSIDLDVPAAESILRKGQLTIDPHHRKAILGNTELELTTTEYKLLLALAAASPLPVSALKLAQSVLGYECSSAEAGELVKYHIHHLRQKIEPDPQKPSLIKTIRFEGYLWAG